MVQNIAGMLAKQVRLSIHARDAQPSLPCQPPLVMLHLMKSTAFLCAGLAGIVALTSCRKRNDSATDTEDSTASRMREQREIEEVPVPDFTAAVKDPQFLAAIKEAAALLGAQPAPLEGQESSLGGFSFDVPEAKIEAILFKAHTNFLAKGCYLFRYHQSFNIGGQPDKAGLLPTTDKYAVIAAMQTDGANADVYTADIIKWLKELEAEQPFVLTGVGFDYLEGNFTAPLKDPRGLARRMYKFCPDIVDQGTGTVEKLAKELQRGRLYFWWD
jgi:hypothetical protein